MCICQILEDVFKKRNGGGIEEESEEGISLSIPLSPIRARAPAATTSGKPTYRPRLRKWSLSLLGTPPLFRTFAGVS